MKAVLVAMLLLGLGACASRPPAPAKPQVVTQKECLRETGSRIKRKGDDGCVKAPGRVLTAEEIEGTGALSVDEALRRLGAR